MVCKVLFLIAIFIPLFSCTAKNANVPAGMAESAVETAESREEFVVRKTAECLSILADTTMYFGQEGHWTDNVFELYEVTLENNIPVIRQIDFVQDEEIVLQTMLLNELLLADDYDWDDTVTFLLQFGDRPPNEYNGSKFQVDNVRLIERNGEISVQLIIGNGNVDRIETNDISELIPDYFDDRRESQVQYAGLYQFERIEIRRDVGSNENTFKHPDKIAIATTGAGNLLFRHYDSDNKANDRLFYIANHDRPTFFGYVADGGGYGTSAYYYFEGDYLIYYFSGDWVDWDISYTIYYNEQKPYNLEQVII